MIIGIDISLEECKMSGYLMMEYNARKKANYSDIYRFFGYNPYLYIQDGFGKYPKEEDCILIDVNWNADSLISMYLENKVDIDGFIGGNHDRLLTFPKNVTYHEILYLADSIQGYCGLDG